MQSYEFEIICKNEIINELYKYYGEKYKIEELHLVWFSKSLQNFKCCVCDLRDNNRYYECTYNGNKKEMYVDIYEKKHNTKVIDKFFKDKVIR